MKQRSRRGELRRSDWKQPGGLRLRPLQIQLHGARNARLRKPRHRHFARQRSMQTPRCVPGARRRCSRTMPSQGEFLTLTGRRLSPRVNILSVQERRCRSSKRVDSSTNVNTSNKTPVQSCRNSVCRRRSPKLLRRHYLSDNTAIIRPRTLQDGLRQGVQTRA